MNTYFNILASYAYLAISKDFCDLVTKSAAERKINLMIDSGAFTAYNAKKTTDYINLDSYCDFLSKYENNCEKYVMLDVILNEKASKQNYETMVKRGFKPMFVVTTKDKDFSYIQDTLKINKNICVAGGVTEPAKWCCARYQNVFYKTGEQAQIHGLGFVKYPLMFQVPIKSVDSSSWTSGLRFGSSMFWNNGLKHLSWQDVLKKGAKIPMFAKQTLENLKISPEIYSQEKYHRGSNQIGLFLTIYAFVQFQRYTKQCGKQLFLAVSNKIQLERILYVYENYNDLDYEKYLKYLNKIK